MDKKYVARTIRDCEQTNSNCFNKILYYQKKKKEYI